MCPKTFRSKENGQNIQSATERNSANDLYELYKYYLYNITAKWIDPLAVSASDLILPGHRLVT